MVRLVEGQIVAEDEDDSTAGGWLRRLLRCRTINFLGFRVPLYWSCVILVFAGLKFGVFGLLFVAAAAGASQYACNNDGGSGGGSGGRRRPFARGSNVRGIGDLPKPPPSS
ncbi:unnamed protein product [Ectocarpus fasciculatus]